MPNNWHQGWDQRVPLNSFVSNKLILQNWDYWNFLHCHKTKLSPKIAKNSKEKRLLQKPIRHMIGDVLEERTMAF